VCVDTEGSGHVCKGDEEIGELIVDMASKPIKDVGALNKDRRGVRVRVPRSGAGTVGEIPAEQDDYPPKGTSTRGSCFEGNVMEDVGDVKCFCRGCEVLWWVQWPKKGYSCGVCSDRFV
jgi:hypothetical protein